MNPTPAIGRYSDASIPQINNDTHPTAGKRTKYFLIFSIDITAM
jgi:hypothetical protein